MKKLHIIAAFLAAAMALASCDKDIGGGNVEVTNNLTKDAYGVVTLPPPTIKASVKKGILPDRDPKVEIAYGETKSFSFNEDGDYTVYATVGGLSVLSTGKVVTLSGGNTEKVTVK
jgi:hypothetical protein